MVFKSDKQRKAVMARLGSGTRSDVSPRFLKDLTGRKLKVTVKRQKNIFVVKDSQNRTIASGKTRASAISRAKFILTG